MTATISSPQVEAAIDACAACARLYQTAVETVGDEEWQRFFERMTLRREMLLERLRSLAGGKVEPKEAGDLVSWRSKFNELTFSLKGLLSDGPGNALATIEPAETRLIDALGAVSKSSTDTDDLMEMLEEVSAARDALRNLLSGLGHDIVEHEAVKRRPE